MLIVSPISWSHHWVWAVPVALACGSAAGGRASRGSPCSWPARSCGRATATTRVRVESGSTTSSATPTCSRPSPCASGWLSRPVLATGHGLGPDAVELGLQLQGPRLLEPVEATVDEGRLARGLGPHRQLEQERPGDGDVVAFTEDVGELMDQAAKPLRFPAPEQLARPPGRSAVAWPPCVRRGAARRAAAPLSSAPRGTPAGRSRSHDLADATSSRRARRRLRAGRPDPVRTRTRRGATAGRRTSDVPSTASPGRARHRRSCASRRPAASPIPGLPGRVSRSWADALSSGPAEGLPAQANHRKLGSPADELARA